MIAQHCLRVAQYTHIKQSDIQTLQEVSVVKLSVGGSDGSLQGPRQIVEEKHLCRLGQLRPNEVEGRDQEKSVWGMYLSTHLPTVGRISIPIHISIPTFGTR